MIDTFPASALVPVPGGSLEVAQAGVGGRPIVLCHGWPELGFSWRHQVPALVDAGYHVIVPTQRGFGRSSHPDEVEAYGIEALTGDLVALLDHLDLPRATFVGHDWGAMVVWGLALLHPERVVDLVNLALPYQERGERPWLEALEALFGPDHYFVHFHRQPGVADAVLEARTEAFLRHLYRANLPPGPPPAGNAMVALAQASAPLGDPILSEEELAVFVEAFTHSGFRRSIHWYRNLDRNWHTLGAVDPIVRQPALMIYGARDPIPPFERLTDYVPRAEVVTLDCGHWIQQERPEDTNRVLLDWLARQHGRLPSAQHQRR